MKWRRKFVSLVTIVFAIFGTMVHIAEAADKKPNILVIMGDDIGWYNPSAYHQGMMGYQTPEH